MQKAKLACLLLIGCWFREPMGAFSLAVGFQGGPSRLQLRRLPACLCVS